MPSYCPPCTRWHIHTDQVARCHGLDGNPDAGAAPDGSTSWATREAAEAAEAALRVYRDTEADLDQARARLDALPTNPGTSSLRGKTHGIRVDAAIRRTAELCDEIRRLEAKLTSLRSAPPAPPATLDLSQLHLARFVRTRWGWFEVVKVNTKSMKVLAAPGMDDRVPIGKILDFRTAPDA